MDQTQLDAEKKQFEEMGFCGPFKVYEPEEAKEILKAVRAKNQDRSKAIYQNDVNYDRHFDISEISRHIAHPNIIARLQHLIGEDIFCWRSEFFPKFPGSPGTEWHQVETYQYTTGKAQLVPTNRKENTPMELTVWTTFTESNKVNGCLKFMPGSHKVWYFDESKTPKTGRDGKEFDPMDTETGFFGYNYAEFKVDPNWEPDESKAVGLEMNPGEAVVFTARCMHGSFPNISKNSTRFAVATRFVPTDVKVYPDQDSFHEHGGHFNLDQFGCVLVSGKDDHGYNKVRTTNNHGESFPEPLQAVEEEVI